MVHRASVSRRRAARGGGPATAVARPRASSASRRRGLPGASGESASRRNSLARNRSSAKRVSVSHPSPFGLVQRRRGRPSPRRLRRPASVPAQHPPPRVSPRLHRPRCALACPSPRRRRMSHGFFAMCPESTSSVIHVIAASQIRPPPRRGTCRRMPIHRPREGTRIVLTTTRVRLARTLARPC